MNLKDIIFMKASTSSPFLEEIILWVDGEWGNSKPENRIKIREGLIGGADCPNAVIAVYRDQAVGVVAFRRFDVPNGEVAALWVDVLFVVASARKCGLGVQLLGYGERVAKRFVRTLYVFTDIPQFYERVGWNSFSEDVDSRKWIVRKEL